MKEKILQAIRRVLGGTQGFKLKLTFKQDVIYEIKQARATQAIILDRILAEDAKHKRRGTVSPPFRFTEEEGVRLAEFLYEENKEEFIKFLHDAIESIEIVK